MTPLPPGSEGHLGGHLPFIDVSVEHSAQAAHTFLTVQKFDPGHERWLLHLSIATSVIATIVIAVVAVFVIVIGIVVTVVVAVMSAGVVTAHLPGHFAVIDASAVQALHAVHMPPVAQNTLPEQSRWTEHALFCGPLVHTPLAPRRDDKHL